jgi:DNA binding domain, excisionase family
MSPEQAAQFCQVSRRTIMRAIESKDLPAIRDNRNRWKIDPEALEKWANAQWAPSERAVGETVDLPTTPTPEPTAENAAALAAAEAEIRVLRERIEDLDRDRNQWRDMALKLASPPPRAPWWPWARRKDSGQ